MKILKKIGIFILVLLALVCIVSLFLPSEVKVERSVLINAPADVVFNQVNDLTQWKSWSYWDNIDPNMKSTFEGPNAGVGAKHAWESADENVGKGSLTVTESKPNSLFVFDLNFEGMGTSPGMYTFKDSAGATFVSTSMSMDMGFFGRIFPGLMMDGMLGGDFEKTLAGLKKRSEEVAAQPAAPAIQIEATTVPAQIVATYKMTTSEKTISADIGNSYMKIGKLVEKNKLNMAGPVLAFYHSYSPEKIEMECAIPVDKMVKGEGDINVYETKAGNAVVAHYYGDYAKSGVAHEAIDKWVKDNSKTVTGSPWEVYVTDPMVEKDTAKWLTEVYYPIN